MGGLMFTGDVIMFSGGKGSWAAARHRRDVDGVDPEDMKLLFTDTNGEHEDLYRFLAEAAADIGAELVILHNDGKTIWDVFEKERMIGNARLSVCSRALKQRPARAWIAQNTDPDLATVVVGIDWTETHRLPAIERSYAPWKTIAPLCEGGSWPKERIDLELAKAGIEQPELYAQGFPHNNCAGACVRAGMGQWARLLEVNPDRYALEEQQEEAFRQKVGKDVAILRDRSLEARLASVGLRRDNVRSHGKEWVRVDTGELVEVPAAAPLTLRALRLRVAGEPEKVDMDDIGGCGCMTDLEMEEEAR